MPFMLFTISRPETAGLPVSTCCLTFRATEIKAYLENDGAVENARAIVANKSARIAKWYDSQGKQVSLIGEEVMNSLVVGSTTISTM